MGNAHPTAFVGIITRLIFVLNKVVLITGASRGLGRVLSLRFAEKGFSVAVNYYQNKEAANQVVSEIINDGGKAETFLL